MRVDPVPEIRIAAANHQGVSTTGEFVLYWMTANRRVRYNFALQRALWMASELRKPLVVLESLRVGYPWASDRLHTFILEGMCDTRRALDAAGVTTLSWVEHSGGEGKALLETLSRRACLVVTDQFPCFFLPRMVASAAKQVSVRLETVDSNGILPLRASDKPFSRAHHFRRHLQRTLPEHLSAFPSAEPLSGYDLGWVELDPAVTRRWPDAGLCCDDASEIRALVGELPIDHTVPAVDDVQGGDSGREVLHHFLGRLERYGDGRNHPDDDVSSGLSPWLHFGHLSAHEVVAAIIRQQGWSPDALGTDTSGKREGWWGMSEGAEAFLDELITWRELGYGFCFHRPHDYHRYSSLPDWAQTTLAEHQPDPRPHVYSLEQFTAAATHDEIWNAAQRQLLREGRIHNYLRMLWGKKILHWTESPEEALAVMIELNNRYALDGRDPNSYSGIFWILGRFDRAWGPERDIFGKVRYMTSQSTRRKLRLKRYLQRYGAPADQEQG